MIVNKLKVLKIELQEAFQVGANVAKLPSSWKGYQKRILHKRGGDSKTYSNKGRSRSRDKVAEESHGGTK